MHPNGKIPPISIPGIGFVYKLCSGTCRGIWFVRTGCCIGYKKFKKSTKQKIAKQKATKNKKISNK